MRSVNEAAPSSPVDPGDHQHVTGAEKVQYRPKLGSAGCCRSAALFSANDATPRRLECCFLNFEVLVVRGWLSRAGAHLAPHPLDFGKNRDTRAESPF